MPNLVGPDGDAGIHAVMVPIAIEECRSFLGTSSTREHDADVLLLVQLPELPPSRRASPRLRPCSTTATGFSVSACRGITFGWTAASIAAGWAMPVRCSGTA